MRTLPAAEHEVVGIDLKPSGFTSHVGSIIDREFVRRHLCGIDAVVHTATLHKPHIATHSRYSFVDTNITGTLNLLEESVTSGCPCVCLHQHDRRLRTFPRSSR